MNKMLCAICGEEIPPDQLEYYRGNPLHPKCGDQIIKEITRLRGKHQNGSMSEEERLRNWAKDIEKSQQEIHDRSRLDLDKKETNLARKAIREIDKAKNRLGLGVTVDKVDPSTLRLLYMKLDELECFVNEAKKPIVDVLAGWARRLR